ncbi:P-loop containing nucleoside triphosphate hydrolase protein [Phycomyces blakesleeanus]|uniref:P-loop containing nucleoside triphosphate hydrolase protein n=1 Tax=Phycomyces blakesleeanus TaxID=4837 RepID=A0ABR3AYY9_PHYBL
MPEVQRVLKITKADCNTLYSAASSEIYDWRKRHQTVDDLSESTIQLGDPGFDKMLGGGILLGSVTEIVGESSSGKTQLGLQLCFAVQNQYMHGEAVYMHSEGRLPTRRLDVLGHHLCPQDADQTKRRIHTMQLTEDGPSQYFSLAYKLPFFIQQHPNVHLVVIDSISALYRGQPDRDRFEQMEELCDLGMRLKKMAATHNIAIVVINQVSDRIDQKDDQLSVSNSSGSGSGVSEWMDLQMLTPQTPLSIFINSLQKKPALGQALAYSVTTRIRLARSLLMDDRKTRRIGCVEFSPFVARQACEFTINEGGIKSNFG